MGSEAGEWEAGAIELTSFATGFMGVPAAGAVGDDTEPGFAPALTGVAGDSVCGTNEAVD